MEGYMGETAVDMSSHPTFSKYGADDWAMLFITKYGGIDGDHHKAWVIDQVARILKGTPVIVREAKWQSGLREYRYSTGNPTEKYERWVEMMRGNTEEDGSREYEYGVGTAP